MHERRTDTLTFLSTTNLTKRSLSRQSYRTVIIHGTTFKDRRSWMVSRMRYVPSPGTDDKIFQIAPPVFASIQRNMDVLETWFRLPLHWVSATRLNCCRKCFLIDSIGSSSTEATRVDRRCASWRYKAAPKKGTTTTTTKAALKSSRSSDKTSKTSISLVSPWFF